MKELEKLCASCMNKTDGSQPCKICGYTTDQEADPNYLKIGTKIMRRFVVGRPIDSNGEGVTYICYDTIEEKKVCLREYCPEEYADRVKRGAIKPKEGKEELFKNGIKKFVDMANKLQQHKDIACLLPIVEVFEGNGTGYFIYEYTEAITLREFLLRNGGVLNWEQTKPIFSSLLISVKALHDADILHLGISPETILIGKDGKVRLTGFLTEEARTANGNITAQLFPGFAAIEQYGGIGTCGTWTDVYAIAATLYRVLVGNPPVESTERVTNDTLSIPENLEKEIPAKVTEAMAEALQIMPDERMKTVDELRAILSVAMSPKKKKDGDPAKSKYKSYMVLTTIMTVLVISIITALIYVFVLMPDSGQSTSSNPSTSIESSSDITSSDDASSEQIDIGSIKVFDFRGEEYHDVIGNINNSKYNFIIEAKQYNDSFSTNHIISQTPAAGELVDPDTADGKITIKVVISLGDYYILMPNVIGMTKENAELTLMKAGFPYSNITINEVYDPEKPANSIISTNPAPGTEINLDSLVTVTFNTYSQDSQQVQSQE